MKCEVLIHAAAGFIGSSAVLQKHLPNPLLGHGLRGAALADIHAAGFQPFFAEIIGAIGAGRHVNFDNLLSFHFHRAYFDKRHHIRGQRIFQRIHDLQHHAVGVVHPNNRPVPANADVNRSALCIGKAHHFFSDIGDIHLLEFDVLIFKR